MLTPLPCWADLPPEQYRERVAGLVEEVEAEARAERESKGLQPLGIEAILQQDPHLRPNRTKKSPAPAFHAASKAVREGSAIPLPSTQAARRRDRALRTQGSLRGDGRIRPPPEAPEEPRACLLVKPVREPDAGDPQVRFDERRRETEPGSRLRHRHYGESRRQQLLPRPTATAPAVDSTFLQIGAGCVILDGADIGAGSILTPNSVVSGRIPEGSIAQGNPAKVIFTRR